MCMCVCVCVYAWVVDSVMRWDGVCVCMGC